MATIKLDDFNPAGSQLFADSETFLQDLSDSDLYMQGGIYLQTTWMWTLGSPITISVSF